MSGKIFRDGAQRLRLLVAIASFGQKNLPYLKQVISTYQSMALDAEIVVFSEAAKSLGDDVKVRVGLPSKDPWSLPFGHQKFFAENADRYDLFIYSEDDVLIAEEGIRAFVRMTELLEPNEIAGFLRYEAGIWTGKSRHKRLELGEQVLFTVPVRGDGLGSLVIGRQNSFGCPVAVRVGRGEILLQARDRNAEISIGEGNEFSNNIAIVANEKITIGDRCRIGDQVAILDCDFHEVAPETRNRSHGPSAPVTIGNNVWLGSRVMVLKGVTIGDNSVIGAMSVVNKSIPANCVAAGFPARVVRFFDCSK